jgi:uncharacterized DUF497 family protein
MNDAVYEWDGVKARSNERKHGVRFEAATLVFKDSFAITEFDGGESAEDRWRTLGSPDGFVILMVAYTCRQEENGDEVIRIISARWATPRERRRYEAERYRHL